MSNIKDIALAAKDFLVISGDQGKMLALQDIMKRVPHNRIKYESDKNKVINILLEYKADIIICTSTVVNGYGHDLLEELRFSGIISYNQVFFLISELVEKEDVLRALEVQPDGFLGWGFSLDVLVKRLTKALEKKQLFKPINEKILKGKYKESLDACDIIIAEQAESLKNEAIQLKCQILMNNGLFDQAIAIYKGVQGDKVNVWANIGLAKNFFFKGMYAESEELLLAIIENNSQHHDAYYWLAMLYQVSGQSKKAEEIMLDACYKFPFSIKLFQLFADYARQVKNTGLLEYALKPCVELSRFSLLRRKKDFDDYIMIASYRNDTDKEIGKDCFDSVVNMFNFMLSIYDDINIQIDILLSSCVFLLKNQQAGQRLRYLLTRLKRVIKRSSYSKLQDKQFAMLERIKKDIDESNVEIVGEIFALLDNKSLQNVKHEDESYGGLLQQEITPEIEKIIYSNDMVTCNPDLLMRCIWALLGFADKNNDIISLCAAKEFKQYLPDIGDESLDLLVLLEIDDKIKFLETKLYSIE